MRDECLLNSGFWSFVCGSPAMRTHGDHADSWFFEHYPWLERHIPFASLVGKDVIEIGIGSGSVARRLAAISRFTALDVADETLAPLTNCTKIRGSILDAPFPEASFDYVVCIGCVHHTGDTERALREIYRILRPSGGCTTMVYHNGSTKPMDAVLWDRDLSGNPPPFTRWFSKEEYANCLRDAGFADVSVTIENMRALGGLNLYAVARKP